MEYYNGGIRDIAMEKIQTAFQIEKEDNVATALEEITSGEVMIHGDYKDSRVEALEKIPVGHKIAVQDIGEGSMIVKYGVPIGRATKPILRGSWVHLHCMRSNYDERSNHLDVVTGAPKDIKYE